MITEIKKGQIGTGLLVENDGYISLDIKNNRQITEAVEIEGMNGMKELPRPFIVHAVFQKYGIENANGRIYPEDILKREVGKYQDKIKLRKSVMELNHPDQATVDLERIAGIIIEAHWEGRTLVGQIEIPVTEGFRKYGIISNLADHVAHLILSGILVGVSSRALGSVKQVGDVLIVSDDLEIICWDFVSDGSTPGSIVSMSEDGLTPYKESAEKDKSKLIKEDRFTEFEDWLSE